jgi:diguanylate cyclase
MRLAERSVPPECLELEITESMLMQDPVRARTTLERLAAIGVSVSVDDFGTGYSSLAHLKRLPVDTLKIDKSFVLDMAEDGADEAIVRSMIELAHNLGMRVVAEGVESAANWVRLAELGCDLAQGFHLSRPLPASGFLALLDAERETRAQAVAR